MMTLDKDTRNAIALAVEKGMTRRMEMYEEVWLTGEQLCERFGMISKGWLEKYGCKLPRERMEVMDDKGRVLAVAGAILTIASTDGFRKSEGMWQ